MKTPSRAIRKARGPKLPRLAWIEYQKLLSQRLDRAWRVIQRTLLPAVTEEVRSRRSDALPHAVSAGLNGVDVYLYQLFGDAGLASDTNRIFGLVERDGRQQLARVVGISIRKTNPTISGLLDSWREQNVAKIKSIPGDMLSDMTKLLEDAEYGNLHSDTIRKKIQERFDVSRSKADLLARDQVLTLNSQITKSLHQQAGLSEYIWTTSGDERVRDSHSALDGQTFRWDTPPVISDDGRTGHPGEDYQCRCTPFPVLTLA